MVFQVTGSLGKIAPEEAAGAALIGFGMVIQVWIGWSACSRALG